VPLEVNEKRTPPFGLGATRRGHLPRQAGEGKLKKRVVKKPDGRYLIYYERAPAARRAAR
jgi:hypothetical protein